jgi:hypothetical protein
VMMVRSKTRAVARSSVMHPARGAPCVRMATRSSANTAHRSPSADRPDPHPPPGTQGGHHHGAHTASQAPDPSPKSRRSRGALSSHITPSTQRMSGPVPARPRGTRPESRRWSLPVSPARRRVTAW